MRAFTITMSGIEQCPKRSFAPSHYREDGTCLCVKPERVERHPDTVIIAASGTYGDSLPIEADDSWCQLCGAAWPEADTVCPNCGAAPSTI